MADMASKDRGRRGIRNRANKLREDDVRYIRAAHSTRQVTAVALAAEFDVSPGAIDAIIHRRNWAWLDEAQEEK